jgi:hypothetical protein
MSLAHITIISSAMNFGVIACNSFFCEKSILSHFVKILNQKGDQKVKVQVGITSSHYSAHAIEALIQVGDIGNSNIININSKYIK